MESNINKPEINWLSRSPESDLGASSPTSPSLSQASTSTSSIGQERIGANTQPPTKAGFWKTHRVTSTPAPEEKQTENSPVQILALLQNKLIAAADFLKNTGNYSVLNESGEARSDEEVVQFKDELAKLNVNGAIQTIRKALESGDPKEVKAAGESTNALKTLLDINKLSLET